MNRLKNFYASFLIVVCMVTTPVFAGTVRLDPDFINRYYPKGSNIYIVPDSASVNPAGCSKTFYYAFPDTHINADKFEKMLLTAVAADKKVAIALYDDQCFDNYPQVKYIYILRR